MLKKVSIFILGVMIVSSLMFSRTLAKGLSEAGEKLGELGNEAGLANNADLSGVVGPGINAALSLVGLIFMILMIYAGYLWMTAQGEEEQVKKAQKIITAALIGLVIVVSAYAITYLVTSKFK